MGFYRCGLVGEFVKGGFSGVGYFSGCLRKKMLKSYFYSSKRKSDRIPIKRG